MARNYTVGRGEVHFSRFKPNTQIGEGFRYLGNTPEFSLTLESEKLEHYSSDRGIREKDASVTIEVARSGSIVADEIIADNIAMFLFGDTEIVSTAGATITSEAINGIVKGRSYQLGETANNPVGASSLVFPGSGGTLFSVKNTAGTTTYTAGTDYVIDPVRGWLTILDASAIANAQDIRVTYTTQASSHKLITSGSEPVNGALKFITFNPIGEQFNWTLPWITISPNGDYNLKGDDWQQIPYSIEILRKGSLEAVYVNGAPFTP